LTAQTLYIPAGGAPLIAPRTMIVPAKQEQLETANEFSYLTQKE